MKLWSVAAVLTGLVLVSLKFRRKHRGSLPAGPGDSDRRYAIDDLISGPE